MKKKAFFAILLGFFFSSIFSFYTISKYNNYEKSTDDKHYHSLIKGVNANHWLKAKLTKDQLSNGKNYFETGDAHDRNYLPSRIFLIYSFISNDELLDSENKIVTNNKKLFFLVFQSLLYFSILFFFARKLFELFDPLPAFFITSFLALEPSLNQWHSSFWSESIFVSLQLLFFYIIIDKNINLKKIIFGGLILGLMFLQRSATILYIFPLIIFFFFYFKKEKTKFLCFFTISFLMIVSLSGFHNLIRAGKFYIAPLDTKYALKIHMIPDVLSKVENISNFDATNKVNKTVEAFKDKNIDLKDEKNLIKYYKKIQNYSYNYILKNPFQTLEIIFERSLHTGVFDPVHVFNFHRFEYKSKVNPWLKSDEHKFWIPIRISYSLIIYIISIFGLVTLFNKDRKIFFYCLFSILYFFFILSWLGNPRYFTPCIIYLSFFFGFGLNHIIEKKLR